MRQESTLGPSGENPDAKARFSELLETCLREGPQLVTRRGADAAVLVTEWPEFVTIDWEAARHAMAGTLIVDGRNALDPDAIRAAGLDYEGVGRP